jgi:hypothetical protein
MGDESIGLELVAQGLARKLLDIFPGFEEDPSSVKNVAEVVTACQEARERLRMMVSHDLVTDARGIVEYQAALDLIIAQGLSIIDGTAEPGVGRAFMHSILAVTQWGVPKVAGQGELLN